MPLWVSSAFMAHNPAHHQHVTLHGYRSMPVPVADIDFWGSVLNTTCSVLQLDNTLDIGFVLAASSAHGHSPQTPQEDYQNPKSRCSAGSVTVSHITLSASAHDSFCLGVTSRTTWGSLYAVLASMNALSKCQVRLSLPIRESSTFGSGPLVAAKNCMYLQDRIAAVVSSVRADPCPRKPLEGGSVGMPCRGTHLRARG